MNILKQTSDEIVTKDNGGGYFIGVVFLLIGLGGIYFYYHTAQSSIGALIVPGIFALVAIFMILMKKTIVVDINKSTGKISFSKKSLLSNQSSEYDIANAQSVELREGSYMTTNDIDQPQGISYGNNYNTRRVLTHQTVLVMKDGTELPLESIKNSNSQLTVMGVQTGTLMSGRGKVFVTSNMIAQFLGVPFNDVNGTGF